VLAGVDDQMFNLGVEICAVVLLDGLNQGKNFDELRAITDYACDFHRDSLDGPSFLLSASEGGEE
jgi:hypothetical protein